MLIDRYSLHREHHGVKVRGQGPGQLVVWTHPCRRHTYVIIPPDAAFIHSFIRLISHYNSTNELGPEKAKVSQSNQL